MKIGIVLSSTPGYSETFFNSKIKGLQAHGMEVVLFCQSKDDNFKGCPVVKSPKITRNPFFQIGYISKEVLFLIPYIASVIRFVKLERKDGVGVIQIFKKIYLNAHLLKAKLDWLHFGFATLALGSETVAQAINAKMAVSIRGFDIAVYPVKYPECYKKLWKYIDKVHTISDDLFVLAKKHGLPKNIPVEKIPPAIDVALFQTTIQNHSSLKKVVFMTTGRLHWKKGYIQTLQALAILKEEGLDFTYKIVGEGKDYERIAFAAYELNLKENVIFLGKLPHIEVKKELESASIYLQYSIQEGFCNAVLEAQAMGKLCIVSNAEGLSENVLDRETGWVVPKYAPEILAKKINEVLSLSPKEKRVISEKAKKRVKNEFNIEKQQEAFMKFYFA
ncbi:glycosyltransferase family 4 protein [Aequorivita sp. Q41]|uniref:glycosyltransferase family 4 protein n=1 Tax=Aequorivita sp. Q41 TaxID=3153300 RepID=UPI003242097E